VPNGTIKVHRPSVWRLSRIVDSGHEELTNGFGDERIDLAGIARQGCRSALPVRGLTHHNGQMDPHSISQNCGPENEICAPGSWSLTTMEWIGHHRTVIAVLHPSLVQIQSTLPNNVPSGYEARRRHV
jgi:hypothetical protein